ncbi:MAG: hypothetical protein RLZZ490_1073 [Cyanobacteriota bacterium]
MSSKFAEMSRQELREYILKNRDDDEALHVYLDRALAEPGTIYPAPQSIDDLKNFPLSKNSTPHS